MKSLVALWILLGFFCLSQSAQCPYSCSRQVRYTIKCGWFGWSRCTRYRDEPATCYRTCVHGGWSKWTVKERGACSVPCGGGVQTVTFERLCNNPEPANGGNQCSGDGQKQEQRACNTHECPIDGGWSDYEIESVADCSVTCGGGRQAVTSRRTCNNPSPQFGGRACAGDETEVNYQSCNPNPCPVDGGWSEWETWQDYDECSALCGGGTKDQWRMRRCDNPAPAYGGNECEGAEKENGTFNCNKKECGDRCPEGANTYIVNPDNAGRYYHCDNGVARLMDCADGTVWDQDTSSCVNDGSQQVKFVLHSGDQCDPTVLYHAHEDCTKFIMCISGVAYEMPCPPGTRFNYDISACDREENVACDN